jgi:hypothetical protein
MAASRRFRAPLVSAQLVLTCLTMVVADGFCQTGKIPGLMTPAETVEFVTQLRSDVTQWRENLRGEGLSRVPIPDQDEKFIREDYELVASSLDAIQRDAEELSKGSTLYYEIDLLSSLDDLDSAVAHLQTDFLHAALGLSISRTTSAETVDRLSQMGLQTFPVHRALQPYRVRLYGHVMALARILDAVMASSKPQSK